MAIPSYTTDLQTVNLCTGTWGEFSGASSGSGPTENDTDNFIAGIDCTSEAVRNNGLSSMYSPEASITIASGDAAFMWLYFASMPVMATYALGGYRVAIGQNSANYSMWNVIGRDTLPKGGWVSVAVDPTITASSTYGSPDGSTATFGSVINLDTGVAKGNAFANDFQRHGRTIILTEGEALNYATFDGASLVNDSINNKWGLFEKVGKAYYQKGRFQMGSASTPVDFRDSDLTINIENTIHVTAGFNVFEVLNISSNIEWYGITVQALGTVSRGDFVVTDNAPVLHSGCTFIDLGTFTYQSNSTVENGTVYRRCNPVTQDSALFTDVKFDSPFGTVGLYSNVLGSVDNCIFNSSGTGYAVDIGSITTTQSLNWKNTESGYVTGVSGTDVGVTPTGNETILCNVSSGEILTINIQTGASIPSVANSGTGTVDVVAGLVTIDWNINPSITGYEYAIYTVTAVGSLEGSSEVQHSESAISDTFSYSYTYSAGVVLAVQIIDDGTHDFVEKINYYPLAENNQSFPIYLEEDINN